MHIELAVPLSRDSTRKAFLLDNPAEKEMQDQRDAY
jgi:hypothetical protein